MSLSSLNNHALLQFDSYIDGEWCSGKGRFDVLNPATGKVIGEVADCGAGEANRAIDAAYSAQPEWAALSAKERGAVLKKWFQLILDNQEDLAILMTAEQGKPLREARAEVGYGASFVEWFAEEGKRAYGDIIPHTAPGSRLMVLKQAVGVCGMITPWNFPSAMVMRKAAPALAAGCTVVIKPSDFTPLSATALAVLAERAGFPKGVLNIVTSCDAATIGKALCDDGRVRKLSFTGSTRVGKILMEQCASTVKKLSLELGGNAPFIVFEDADIDAAVDGAVGAKFRNCGQVCVSPNRFYIHDSIYDIFAQKLAERVQALNPGDGYDEGSDLGPLINEAGLKKVEGYIKDACSKGAKVLVGGKAHALGQSFFEPTVLSGVDATMKIAKEEVFGPVAPLFRFSDVGDVIRQANDTEYGLASYFYSKDISKIWAVAEALEYGMVGVNSSIIATEVAPFGGVKQSGIGREGSKYGLDEFLEMKYVYLGGLT